MTDPTTEPENLVVVLLDSLNRHLLGCYGADEFETPNIDRLAARSVRFTRHYAGSLPCMPARHDILCGALDFLWKPWGSVELWEQPVTEPLRHAGVTTMLVTDHPHLFETGGENYHGDFTAWDYVRGHEGDQWRTRPDPSWAGTPQTYGRGWSPYDNSRSWFRGEEDFPGPKTMAAATEWLRRDAPHHERFLLYIDEFDPHEPFDTPEPYASMYDPDWEGAHFFWPPYAIRAVRQGLLTEREGRQIRACYGAKLTMIDAWFGRLLDALDETGRWEDTGVVLCTDHGHYLGERDIWGKPPVLGYDEMNHTPLLVAWPGVPAGTCDALTTSVDIFATICDVFDVTVEQRTHGHSLAPLVTGATDRIREHALTGVWGREVHLVTDRHKYGRAPVAPTNRPLSMFSNRWSTMPTHHREGRDDVGMRRLLFPRPDDRAWLDRMPGSDVPVIRQPFGPDDDAPFWSWGNFRGHTLFDHHDDPGEEVDRSGDPVEAELADLLREALVAIEAPDDQLQRLGLA